VKTNEAALRVKYTAKFKYLHSATQSRHFWHEGSSCLWKKNCGLLETEKRWPVICKCKLRVL